MVRKTDSDNNLHVPPSPNHIHSDYSPVRVLIAFGTRHGATADAAHVIAKSLENEYSVDVKILDLKRMSEDVDLDGYDAVIIGSSIVMGRWTKEVQEFLKSDFSGTKVALFVCAAYSCGKAAEQGDWSEYETQLERIVGSITSKHSIIPFATRGFGGRVAVRGNTILDNWNREDIEEWARNIGDIITKTDTEVIIDE